MHYILFDDLPIRQHLLPLTYTRSVADIRCGIFTMKERWDHHLQTTCGVRTEAYLQAKYGLSPDEGALYINNCFFATAQLVTAIQQLQSHQHLCYGDCLVASGNLEMAQAGQGERIQFEGECKSIQNLWDIFSLNDWALRQDFNALTSGRVSATAHTSNTIIGDQIFIEEGAKLHAAIINTESGPVYIAKNAEVMEGCMIRGPFALCENAQTKMGAKIYGATTLGPGCKVGGEVNNAVFFANSSKAHDGFIGNAVIGEWCNIGADSNNSNLKNNYEEVKLWSEHKSTFVKTSLQFCGLIMADHSKCGINTMFNTGTVVGVSANIFGAGFPRNFVPSFSWGGASGFTTYALDKAVATAIKVFERRHLQFNELDKQIFEFVFKQTQAQRT